MKANYHTHTFYSDGNNSVDEMVSCAISNDFDIIGISDHSPVPFDSQWNMKFEKLTAYLEDIRKAKEQYQGRIEVLAGMEVDYFDGLNNIEYYKSYGLDYTIGSVHYVGNFPNGKPFNIDKSSKEFSKGLILIYEDNIENFVSDYYQKVIKMVLSTNPDIIAHLTLVEKFNKTLKAIDTQSSWYRDLIYMTLDILRHSDSILELNARSWYRGLLDEFVPSLWVMKIAKEFNIPVTISGDIHQPQEYGMFWDDAVEFLKAAGYEEITILRPNENRQTVKI